MKYSSFNTYRNWKRLSAPLSVALLLGFSSIPVSAQNMTATPGTVNAPSSINVPNTPSAEAPIVPQADGSAERPMPAPFVLSAHEQAQTDAVLARWEGFSMGIETFETNFTRILYRRTLDSSQLQKTQEIGELRYAAPDRGMFAVNTSAGEPSEKWLCDGMYVFEYKFAQKQIDQYTLPPEMRGKGITQGPLPFLFGASAVELKRRYYIRQTQPSAELARPGQVWLEAYPKKAEDASEFQRAEMIISFGNEVRPLAIKLFKANGEQHVYIFDLRAMKVNKTQLLPSTWVPSVPEKMRMKLVPVE
ncbi:MAG: hypothetical protein Q4C70_05675 [Planctomycetia bacterium]|nr:hypothetical protein [Planctomycetia bacterium]